jgi:hypothetical protein
VTQRWRAYRRKLQGPAPPEGGWDSNVAEAHAHIAVLQKVLRAELPPGSTAGATPDALFDPDQPEDIT